ncbi:MAG TPA: tRNA (adenosine(37)-N6)-dimethylallyltransferase MiaA [Desulfuromonadales bacterium]|nr:tRNA (adenosine(37)-N6)-dimethylallyltransferase MiaA [Desulfuromonadales bacterium]
MHPFTLITILGATASGKTRLAVGLAQEVAGEIISADSRQVFRGMDIGSGKDLHEYGEVPYHLIDILDAGEEFSVFAFQQHFLDALTDISSRGKMPILCGGSGMYLDAALRGYRMVAAPANSELRAELASLNDGQLADTLHNLRPLQHNNTDLTDRQRTIRAIEIAHAESHSRSTEQSFPTIRHLVIGIRWERSELRRRITARLKQRLENGLVEEVFRLHDGGIPWQRLDYYGLEYRFVGAFLRGEMTYNNLFQRLNSAIHDLAKRQGNWFRRMERHGITIHWLDGDSDPLADARILTSCFTTGASGATPHVV